MIQKRLSSLSLSSNNSLRKNNSLKNSGYNSKLEYEINCNTAVKKRRKRKKKVFHYNPPFCTSLKTNLGKEFLKLVDKHFPKSGIFNKILNRNTIKICCSKTGTWRNLFIHDRSRTLHWRILWNKKHSVFILFGFCPIVWGIERSEAHLLPPHFEVFHNLPQKFWLQIHSHLECSFTRWLHSSCKASRTISAQ